MLIRRTGAVIAALTREGVPQDVVSVMAATMLGSIETMSEALGSPSPEQVTIETERCRMLASKVEAYGVVVLAASRDVPSEELVRVSRRAVRSVARAVSRQAPRSTRPLAER